MLSRKGDLSLRVKIGRQVTTIDYLYLVWLLDEPDKKELLRKLSDRTDLIEYLDLNLDY